MIREDNAARGKGTPWFGKGSNEGKKASTPFCCKTSGKETSPPRRATEKKAKKHLQCVTELTLALGAANSLAAILAYHAVYARWERPDYTTVLGEYYYPRIAHRLPRRTFDYYPCGRRLRGYYYPSAGGRGCVLFRHGLRSGADDYLPLISAVVAAGYDLFTFDGTGAFDSSGDGTLGACQWLIDLSATVSYLRANGVVGKERPLYLLGHSLGGFAVTAALPLINGVSAVASISGMNDGVSLLSDTAARYVRPRALLALPSAVFYAYQRLLFGAYADLSAAVGISSTSIPVLVAHGESDRVLPLQDLSINAHAPEITNPQVDYLVTHAPHDGHDTILLSSRAIDYRRELAAECDRLALRRGRGLSYAERAELALRIDHRKYSEPNLDLVERIVHTFERAEKCGK